MPRRAPHTTRREVAAVSRADHIAQAASTRNSVMIPSGSLDRKMAVATGVTASAVAARTAATSPVHRRTRWNTTITEAAPARATGASIERLENPKMRPESSIIHSEAGGLSTVMNDDRSSDPKNMAFQLSVPLLTAAA